MRRAVAALVASAGAVAAVLAYRTPHAAVQSLATTPVTAEPQTSSTVVGAPSSVPTSPTGPSTTPPLTARTVTATGAPVPATQPHLGWSFGVVDVQVTVEGSRVVSVRASELPPVSDTGGAGTQPTTVSISNYAAPILVREALAAQGPDVATVSGATYTCRAFQASLESALARARA